MDEKENLLEALVKRVFKLSGAYGYYFDVQFYDNSESGMKIVSYYETSDDPKLQDCIDSLKATTLAVFGKPIKVSVFKLHSKH